MGIIDNKTIFSAKINASTLRLNGNILKVPTLYVHVLHRQCLNKKIYKKLGNCHGSFTHTGWMWLNSWEHGTFAPVSGNNHSIVALSANKNDIIILANPDRWEK